jgi:hypothetical protein
MHKKGEDGSNMAGSRDLEIKRDQERICERRCASCLREEDA